MKRFFRGLSRPPRAHRIESATSPDAVDLLTSTIAALQQAAPPQPREASLVSSRRRLLSSLQTTRATRTRRTYPWLTAPVAMSAAAVFLFIGGLTAGAATLGPQAPFSQVLGVFGLAPTDENGSHGDAVSTAVQDAIASSTPGADRGEAVSTAACAAAHDRTTLPEGAQNAPGIEGQDPKVCATETPSPEDTGDGAPELAVTEDTSGGTDAAEASPSVTPNHGDSVSGAVHDAIASTTPGPDRGPAVSEAACDAAHDRSTLPEGAQNAPGQQDAEPKDCTHPDHGSEETPDVDSGTSGGAPPTTSPDTNPGEQNGQGQGQNPGNGAGNGNGDGSGSGNGEGKPDNPGEPDKGPDKDLPSQSQNKKP